MRQFNETLCILSAKFAMLAEDTGTQLRGIRADDQDATGVPTSGNQRKDTPICAADGAVEHIM